MFGQLWIALSQKRKVLRRSNCRANGALRYRPAVSYEGHNGREDIAGTDEVSRQSNEVTLWAIRLAAGLPCRLPYGHPAIGRKLVVVSATCKRR